MAVIPARYKLTIWKGATFRKRLTVLQGDRDSAPKDLTGYTGIMTVWDKPEGSVLFTLSTQNGRIAINAQPGTVDLIISADDTSALNWKEGHYDIKITAPNGGDTDAILFGQIVVRSI